MEKQAGKRGFTRRDLARVAAASGAALLQGGRAAAQNMEEKKYGGALEGSEGKVDPDSFDPVLYTRKLYETAPLKLTFHAENRKQAEIWQKKLRPKIAELVGGFPAQRAPLAAQTLEV